MLRPQWDALRCGDLVNVHDPASATMTLIPGVVVMIDAHADRNSPGAAAGAGGVGIRVADSDGTRRILRPAHVAVHLEPVDPAEPCWRCQEIAARQPVLRQCGRCRQMFAGDPTLAPGLDTGWWACAECHELLLGPGAMAMPARPPKSTPSARAS